MKPVFQTKFGDGVGNCLNACVASIFEIGINDIIDFNEYSAQLGNSKYNSVGLWHWAKENGYFLCNSSKKEDIPNYIQFYIATGNSPRGNLKHAVVFSGGKLVHDPHPDQTGVMGEPLYYWWFIKYDWEK